jgi:menaquinone-9 beta-reductase
MTDQVDVTIVGAGIAGMAASIHLANAGLRVVCIEADPLDSNPIGESLDCCVFLLNPISIPG